MIQWGIKYERVNCEKFFVRFFVCDLLFGAPFVKRVIFGVLVLVMRQCMLLEVQHTGCLIHKN